MPRPAPAAPYSPQELARNHGGPARAIEVAAEHDIVGSELTDIASRLDLTDHQLTVPRHTHTVTGDPRSGRRYLSRGRKLLAALGVWPWAHVEDWSRTRRWWRDPAVESAIQAWHDRAWVRAAERLAFSARARNGAPNFRVITVEEYEACRAFRARLVELHETHRLDQA